jgi:hypothetical protein
LYRQQDLFIDYIKLINKTDTASYKTVEDSYKTYAAAVVSKACDVVCSAYDDGCEDQLLASSETSYAWRVGISY